MIHIVYPHGERKAAPWSIGNHLASVLRARGCEVKQYDWEDCGTLEPANGDVLIGHPHDSGGRIFNQSVRRYGWKRRIAIAPWNGSPEYTERLERVAPHCDRVLAICGEYWAERFPSTWNGKTNAIPMAISSEDYPQIKQAFNPIGQRRILYVGCALDCKGVALLSEIARQLPGVPISHIGPGLIPGTWPWGYLEMETEQGRHIAAQHDFLIAPGKNDANPTTVLEAAAWGLIPIATKESGWGAPPAVHIPQDPARAVEVIKRGLSAPEEKLKAMQALNLELVRTRYTWEAFCGEVIRHGRL